MSAKDEFFRLFAAIEPPHEIRGTLERVQASLKYKPGAQAVRWNPPDRMHLTLSFLGDVSAEKVPELDTKLAAICVGRSAFSLKLAGLGCFPSFKRPAVIWIGVESSPSDSLATLQHDVAQATRVFQEKEERRGFAAHLTLGRVKPGHAASRLIGETIKNEQLQSSEGWRATRVCLIKSELLPEGPRYLVLKEYGLAEPAKSSR